MIIGAGDLGRRVCHDLSHAPGPRHVRLVGRDGETALRSANLARFSAVQRGWSPTVDYAVTDVTDTGHTAEVIAQHHPDVIFLALSYQSWWVILTLPEPAFKALYAANFGPWLPMHLAPVLHAMRAVRAAGSDAVVVNAAYPDAVHPALAPAGLAPHLGVGNVANNVPGIRAAAADQLGVPVGEVEARLVAHHYVSHRLSRQGDSGAARMALSVRVAGQDATGELDVPDLLAALPARYRRTGGLPGQAMTAASAVSVLEPLAERHDALVHAPGPLGRAGGYPVELAAGEIRLALPPGLSETEAEQVNVSGQVCDGISEIRADGTVCFEPASMAVLTRELGYECAELPLADAPGRARELGERFASYRRRVTG